MDNDDREILPDKNPRSLDDFEERLWEAREKGTTIAHDICRLCYKARETLPKLEFEELATRLDWTPQDISMYAKSGQLLETLAEDERQLLPESESTLYALARASDEVRKEAFAAGIVKPELTRSKLSTWLKTKKETEFLRSIIKDHGNIPLEDAIKKLEKKAA